MPTRRQQRISELLLEELGILISVGLDDSRLNDAMIRVTAVEVSPDLRNARVFVEHRLPPESSRLVLRVLRHATPYLRRTLAESLNLRLAPELSFHIDDTDARALRIEKLLDTIAHEDAAREDDGSNDAD